eukprot:scaffold425917_cov35-Prasinocladus_malaysianus.AAC.1
MVRRRRPAGGPTRRAAAGRPVAVVTTGPNVFWLVVIVVRSFCWCWSCVWLGCRGVGSKDVRHGCFKGRRDVLHLHVGLACDLPAAVRPVAGPFSQPPGSPIRPSDPKSSQLVSAADGPGSLASAPAGPIHQVLQVGEVGHLRDKVLLAAGPASRPAHVEGVHEEALERPLVVGRHVDGCKLRDAVARAG